MYARRPRTAALQETAAYTSGYACRLPGKSERSRGIPSRVCIIASVLLCTLSSAQAGNLWLFDMGSDTSPLWPGFARVTPSTSHSAEQGYGWVSKPKELRAYTASNIDALAIDDISGLRKATATFRVDVPDGDYTVWVLTGAMGNIWRLRYLRMPHELLVQGKPAATVDYGEEGLFRVANYDWKSADDPWMEFIEPRFRWLRTDAAVTEGKLVLGFRNANDFPVNAIIVASRRITDRVANQITIIDRLRRDAFHGLWQEHRPERAPIETISDEERQRGYVVAEAHCSDHFHPWSTPGVDAGREHINLFATPGAQEQVSFAVYALRDLESVTFAVSELRSKTTQLPETCVKPGLVQFAPWHAGKRDVPAYAIKECLILPLRPTSVGSKTCKRFWITIDMPADVPEGLYEGTITVNARNAPSAELRLAVRTVPVTLDPPPVERFMYFGTMYYLGKAYLPNYDVERFWDAMRAEVRFMRDNQYCRAECLIPRGSGGVKLVDGHVVSVNLRDTTRLMQILKEEDAWPRDNTMICRTGGLNLMFGGHFHRPKTPGVQFIPSEEGRRKYTEAIRFIDQHAKAEGWPEIAFECLGEFTNFRESGKTFALEVHKLLHDLGVSNTVRGNGPSDMAPIEEGLVTYPQPNWAMMFPDQLEVMRRTGKRLWAYNFSRSRFSLGWFCWRHGITRASYESGVYANGQPGNVFEITGMFPMGLPTSMTTIEPTVWLKRLVQGAVDYEYLYTLDRRLRTAEKSDNKNAQQIAREARKWLDEKLSDIPAGSTYVRGDPRSDKDVQGTFWPVRDLDRYRWQMAQFIMEIGRAMEEGQ